MDENGYTEQGRQMLQRSIEIFIRIGLIVLLLVWGFQILRPFIDLLAWAGIIAVALYPVTLWLAPKVGGSVGRASGLLTFILIALIILPTAQLASSSVEASKGIADQLQAGTLKVPAPPEGVTRGGGPGERRLQEGAAQAGAHQRWRTASASDVGM